MSTARVAVAANTPLVPPALEVSGVSVFHETGRERRMLVNDVSFAVAPNEVVAIVGESGSGKSLLARAVSGLLPRSLAAEGTVQISGGIVRELGENIAPTSGIGLVLQDPFTQLNPLMRCGTQICEAAAVSVRRLNAKARAAFAAQRLADVGIDRAGVAQQFPFQLSGGMQQRVALAAALANEPKVLIADEFSTALDVVTQRAIWLLLRGRQREADMALLVITHDLRMAFSLCDRVLVMYAGSIVEVGPADAVSATPRHPYTHSLILAEPRLDRAATRPGLSGRVPAASDVSSECGFSARCPWAESACVNTRPSLQAAGSSRATACRRWSELQLPTEREDRDVSSRHERPVARATVLEVDGVTKAYIGARGDQHIAVDRVSLTVGRAECVAIVGESGSGKTTIARCVAGLVSPSQGKIVIAGMEATYPLPRRKRRRETLAHLVQMVFQDPYSSLNPSMSVGRTLTEAVRCAAPEKRQTVATLMDTVGLPQSHLTRRPAALSGGERQRVAIARSIAVGPELLVCDEPVSALDVSVQAQILELLLQLKDRGTAMLFITHDLAVAQQVADRIIVMRAGVVVESGAAVEILASPRDQYTRTLIGAVPGEWDRDDRL